LLDEIVTNKTADKLLTPFPFFPHVVANINMLQLSLKKLSS